VKILHTGDWHIGNQLDAKDFGRGESSRTVESQNILLEMAEYCDKVDVLVFAGDLFHYSYPAPYLVSIAQDFIKNAKQQNPKLKMFDSFIN
jgi:DNA repair exonuclease SbcCD nuclease subunit